MTPNREARPDEGPTPEDWLPQVRAIGAALQGAEHRESIRTLDPRDDQKLARDYADSAHRGLAALASIHAILSARASRAVGEPDSAPIAGYCPTCYHPLDACSHCAAPRAVGEPNEEAKAEFWTVIGKDWKAKWTVLTREEAQILADRFNGHKGEEWSRCRPYTVVPLYRCAGTPGAPEGTNNG